MDVSYRSEPELSSAEFVDVLERSTLAERRPVDQPERIADMLRHADVIITARVGDLLVGVSRALTDYAFCTYLSDLAVDEAFQGHGIGRELIRRTHEAGGLHTTLILIAAPKAETYYPHVGMNKHPSCWTLPRRPASLHRDEGFTFRFADDRIVPRFHLEGTPPGRAVRVYRLDSAANELLVTAVSGAGGWVELPTPLVVHAGGGFVAVVG